MTQVDGTYVLGAGKTATLTLTIQNPRGDGVPVMGQWSVSFDPRIISVSCGGDESWSNQTHLIRSMTSSQTITLTVTGVSGGSTGIYASWDVWSDPTASSAWQFGIGGSQSLSIKASGVDIDTDSNGDGAIDHVTDDPIEDQDPGRVMTVHKDGIDDLAKVILRPIGIIPTAPNQVMVELDATGNIRVWGDSGRSIPIITGTGGSATWDLYNQTFPSEVYVEGLALGGASLEWKVTVNGQQVGDDTVKFTITVPWTRVDNWSSSGAFVKANINNASLSDLANDITGNPGDASLLNAPGNITRGRWINVKPLIKKLEDNIRGNVMAAANAHKFAHFPVGDEDFIVADGMHEDQINQIFTSGNDSSVDCLGMARIVEIKGLIQSLKPGEFDKLFASTSAVPGIAHPCLLNALKPGDWVYFRNDPRYLKKHKGDPMQGENAIMIGSDSFWGWGIGQGGAGTYAQWIQALIAAYNEGLPSSQQIKTVPGYDGLEKFFDVMKIGMKIFDLRSKPNDNL
jgi:hypothetical protein